MACLRIVAAAHFYKVFKHLLDKLGLFAHIEMSFFASVMIKILPQIFCFDRLCLLVVLCYIATREEHGSGLDRTGSGLKSILAGSVLDRTAIF